MAGDVEERREAAGSGTRSRTRTPAPRRAAASPVASIGDSGTPPMNATASTIAHITIAEPRSPWTRQAPAANGGDAGRSGAGCGGRRTAASWRRTEQVGGEHDEGQLEELRRLQAERADRDPGPGVVDGRADAGHERQRHAGAGEDDAAGSPGACTHARCMRIPMSIPTRPIAGPHHLAVEDVVRAVALRRLDAGRRRQHHHQPEHHEHGDDDADHVVGGGRRAALDVPHAADAAGVGRASTVRRPARPAAAGSRRRAAARAPAGAGRPTDRAAGGRRAAPSVVAAVVERASSVVRLRSRACRPGAGSRRRAPGSRRRGTSRSWRSRATAARRRRAGPSSPAAVDGARPSSRGHDRRRRRRTWRRSTPAASPIATTARTRSGLGGHRRQVEALVAARRRSARRGRRPGWRPTRRAAWSPWSRCTSARRRLADELDAVRRADERRQRRRRPRRARRAGLEHQRGGGERVGEVVGQRPAQRGDRGQLARAARRARRRHRCRRRGSRRRSAPNVRWRAGAAARWRHHDRVVGEADGHVAGRCWLKMRALAAL